MKSLKIGYAMCGAFCDLSSAIKSMERLKSEGHEIIAIMSNNAYTLDTRYGNAIDIIAKIESVTEKEVLHQITQVEPIGRENMTDIMVISPCTGNTLAKLANGISDTAVTLAAKSHLRNQKPLVIAITTNDGLSAAFQNLGHLMNVRNIYFVPFSQDNVVDKPNSLVANFDLIPATIEKAMKNEMLEPRFYGELSL